VGIVAKKMEKKGQKGHHGTPKGISHKGAPAKNKKRPFSRHRGAQEQTGVIWQKAVRRHDGGIFEKSGGSSACALEMVSYIRRLQVGREGPVGVGSRVTPDRKGVSEKIGKLHGRDGTRRKTNKTKKQRNAGGACRL